MFKKFLLPPLCLLVSQSIQAADYHIADDVQLFMNSGPSYQYRISGRVRSGESIAVLERSGDYTKIQLNDGKSGWVPSRYIAEGSSQLDELPVLRKALDQSNAKLGEQESKIETLSARLTTLQTENDQYTQEMVQRDSQIRDLQFEIQNMDQSNLMRWLTHGGLIALGGVILGLIIPNLPKRRKPRDEWF